MRQHAKAAIVSGLDAALSALGYDDQDLVCARASAIGWARARTQATRRRTGVVAGVGIVVTGRGRAELQPLERSLAGPAEVTVEVLVSAVSPGTERAQWLRLPNAQPDFPYAPGYCGAGRVIAAGAGVPGIRPGQLVAVARLPHASVATVPAAWVTPVPDDVDVAEAALVYLAIIAGYGVERAGLSAGEPLCIIGAGPIGALAQRLALIHAPGPVTVVAASRRREELAMRGGAARFLTAAEGVAGVDAAVVIEATGDPAALASAVAAARAGATVVLLGSPRGTTAGDVLLAAQRKGLRLVGAHISSLATEMRRSGRDPFQELAHAYLSAVGGAALDASDLVGEALDPREVLLGYRRLARGELVAAHFDWRRLPPGQRLRRRSLVSRPTLPDRRPSIAALPSERAHVGARLRFSLVGCGDVGLHNAAALAAAANAELVACHDPVRSLADATAARFGAAPVATIEEAFDAARVDATFLCVPHDLHAPLIERAAAAGLHVVVEKPLANNLAEARRAVEGAERAGVALSVCFPFRYEPAIQAARSLVRAGAIGELRGATVVFHADKPESYWVGGFSGRSPSGWRSSRDRSGGGVLIMNLTHYVDFIRYVTGAEPESVTAAARFDPDAEIEDGIALTVQLRGGALGSISGSASTRGAPATRFELWGETGTLQLEPEPAIYSERALDGLPAGRWCALPREPGPDPRTLFVERFAAAVLAGAPVDVPAADGLAVQALVEAAYSSAQQGTAVAVEGPSA